MWGKLNAIFIPQEQMTVELTSDSKEEQETEIVSHNSKHKKLPCDGRIR